MAVLQSRKIGITCSINTMRKALYLNRHKHNELYVKSSSDFKSNGAVVQAYALTYLLSYSLLVRWVCWCCW